MKYLISSIIIITFFYQGKAQDYDWQPKTREIVITFNDSVVRAKTLIEQKSGSIHENYTYYWYSKDQINKNKGGFTGELLQGEYLVFNRDKHLITQGEFEKGLMTGIWKYWYPNGQLKCIENYRRGFLDGEQRKYNVTGKLISATKFRNGQPVIKNNHSFQISSWFMSKTKNDTIPASADSSRANTKN